MASTSATPNSFVMKSILYYGLTITVLSTFSCATSNTDEQTLKGLLVKANEEMLNKGNYNYADEVFTAEYGEGGPEQIKLFIKELRTAFPDLKVKVEPIIAEGNMLAWRREHTGTHKGSYLGFQASHKTIQWTAILISRYENGKVAEEWAEDNLLEVLLRESKE